MVGDLVGDRSHLVIAPKSRQAAHESGSARHSGNPWNWHASLNPQGTAPWDPCSRGSRSGSSSRLSFVACCVPTHGCLAAFGFLAWPSRLGDPSLRCSRSSQGSRRSRLGFRSTYAASASKFASSVGVFGLYRPSQNRPVHSSSRFARRAMFSEVQRIRRLTSDKGLCR
jgi:hypothetical protein